MIDPQFVQQFAEAIATMEGFYNDGSLASKNNNPGNLRRWGNATVVNGYASFPTAEEGWRVLRKQITLNIDRGLTTREFFCGKPGVYGGYAPSCDGNQPLHYAEFVAGKLRIDPDAVLKTAMRKETE